MLSIKKVLQKLIIGINHSKGIIPHLPQYSLIGLTI